MNGGPGKLSYSPLEYIPIGRPVDRIRYLSDACVDRVVLDLGALDETAYTQKRGSGTWLHAKLAEVAIRVVGIDLSEDLPSNGLVTGDNAIIKRGDLRDLEVFLTKERLIPDVVIAGELIEHMENPQSFLKNFRSIVALKGKKLLFSTPNATAMHNCGIALLKRESCHRDHLCVLSFKTINTLLWRAGFESWNIIPYHAEYSEIKGRNPGWRGRLVSGGERVVHLLENIFPLLSFGFVVETEI